MDAPTTSPEPSADPANAASYALPPAATAVATSARSRRSLRRWAADLHGGQLIMLLLFLVPVGGLTALWGLDTKSSADSAATNLASGEYREHPSYVTMAGELYRMTKPVPAERLARFRSVSDSALREGVSPYTVEGWLKETGEVERAYYVRPRAELEANAAGRTKGLALITLGLAMIVFSVWALWVWLGARSRGAKGRTL